MSPKSKPLEVSLTIRIRDAVIRHLIALGAAILFWATLTASYGLDLAAGFF